jgi:beta-galactosidase
MAVSAMAATNITRLATGWEHYRGSLGSAWEIWRGTKATDNVEWTPVTVPHCFNARDSVEPDSRYYQGPGWYRTRLQLANPFPNGRTLLHFGGAGQRSEVFVGLEKVAEHLGGYDEWEVDITEAAQRALAKEFSKGEVPLAVLCDNSRDAESIPSDLSDFIRYGGLYRHVSLVYVPAIALQRAHIEPALSADGKGTVKVRVRFYNPTKLGDQAELTITVRDPAGKTVHSSTMTYVWFR